MEALIVLSVVAAGGAGIWAAKALKERQQRIAAVNDRKHDVDIAELVVMAMLADGKITPEEWGVVRSEFTRHGYSLLDTDRVISRLKADADRLRASGELGPWVAEQGAELGPEDREQVYRLVVELSLSGSTLSSPSGEYRSVLDGQPKTLLGLFGDNLAIPGERQREINLAHLRRNRS